jgi:hypothetical protein
MAAQKMVRVEVDGAEISMPELFAVEGLLARMNRQSIHLAATSSAAVPRIGEVWPGQGGVNGGLMRGINGNRDYYLIVPTHKDAFIKEITWGGRDQDEPGAMCEYDGYANTNALCESKHDHPAPQWARSRVIDGFTDLYLPARRECRVIQANVPELFVEGYHWTSTQYSSYGAWVQDFVSGLQYGTGKYGEYAARVVRRLFI